MFKQLFPKATLQGIVLMVLALFLMCFATCKGLTCYMEGDPTKVQEDVPAEVVEVEETQ